jgi:hypothetical protein
MPERQVDLIFFSRRLWDGMAPMGSSVLYHMKNQGS